MEQRQLPESARCPRPAGPVLVGHRLERGKVPLPKEVVDLGLDGVPILQFLGTGLRSDRRNRNDRQKPSEDVPDQHGFTGRAIRTNVALFQSLRITPMFLLLLLWMKRLLSASSVFCGVNCGLMPSNLQEASTCSTMNLGWK